MSAAPLPRRHGVTLVELLVAVAIGALALTAIFYLFRQSRGTAASAEERLSVLHQARLLVDLMKRDVACLHLDGGEPDTAIRSTPELLSFARAYAVDDGGAKLSPVEWRYDPTHRAVSREFRGERRLFGGGPVLVTRFEMKRRSHTVGTRRATWFDLAFTMRSERGDDRSEIAFRERLHPPRFDGDGPKWNR